MEIEMSGLYSSTMENNKTCIAQNTESKVRKSSASGASGSGCEQSRRALLTTSSTRIKLSATVVSDPQSTLNFLQGALGKQPLRQIYITGRFFTELRFLHLPIH